MTRGLLILLAFSFTSCFATTLSRLAENRAQPIYLRILKHSFLRELRQGTLSINRFHYYLEQDRIYLSAFGQSLGKLAAKLSDSEGKKFVREEAVACIKEEPPMKLSPRRAEKLGRTTAIYREYLLTTAHGRSREELIAALLPCYWIYLKLADDLYPQIGKENPYRSWVGYYHGASYRRSVERMLRIADALAQKASPETRKRMLRAFLTATKLEEKFFADAYREGR